MLNLTIRDQLQRNIDGYKNISKRQLEDLFTRLQGPKIPIPLPRHKNPMSL